MPASPILPGLDRFIAVCQQHSLPLQLTPPLASAPRLGELVLGEPFDPQLAAVYQRLGSAELGPLTLFASHFEEGGLLGENEWLRQYDHVHIRSTLVFGKEAGFAYYHGTVPQLANSQGLQPVVFISNYEEKYAAPVASSVDLFFYLYSHHLELLVSDPCYGQDGAMLPTFPWDMTHLITRDEPLMESVLAGRFDFLADNEPDALKWLQQLRTARL
jgi:hypothetical protein